MLQAQYGRVRAQLDGSVFRSLYQPFLVASFPQPHAVLSWSLTRPGFAVVSSVAWLYVRDDDLSMDVDPALLLEKACSRRD